MLTERRLGDSHLFRGTREIEVFGDSQEISQLSEFDPRRVFVDLGSSALLIQRHGTAGLSGACQFSSPSQTPIPPPIRIDWSGHQLSEWPLRRFRGGLSGAGCPMFLTP